MKARAPLAVVLSVVVIAFALCRPAAASIVTYTDRAAFQGALGSFTTDPMNYATVGTVGSGAVTGLNFYHFMVATVPDALKIIQFGDGFGAFDTTGDIQAKFLYLDTDIGFQGSAATFSMHDPTYGFGFSYTGVTQAGTSFTAQLLGSTFDLAVNPDGSTALFWGAISTVPFNTIVLTTSNESGYGVDDVTFGTGSAVPEPASMLLLGTGLLGLRRVWRRRRP